MGVSLQDLELLRVIVRKASSKREVHEYKGCGLPAAHFYRR